MTMKVTVKVMNFLYQQGILQGTEIELGERVEVKPV